MGVRGGENCTVVVGGKVEESSGTFEMGRITIIRSDEWGTLKPKQKGANVEKGNPEGKKRASSSK